MENLVQLLSDLEGKVIALTERLETAEKAIDAHSSAVQIVARERDHLIQRLSKAEALLGRVRPYAVGPVGSIIDEFLGV